MECEERDITVRAPRAGQCQNSGGEVMGGFVSPRSTAHAASHGFSWVFPFNGNRQLLWWEGEGTAEMWDPLLS